MKTKTNVKAGSLTSPKSLGQVVGFGGKNLGQVVGNTGKALGQVVG